MARLTGLVYHLLTFLAVVQASSAPKQVLITYPDDTPPHILDQAKDALLTAGGVITHEFALIKGFSATVAESALDTLTALSTEFPPLIEHDQVVTTQEQA